MPLRKMGSYPPEAFVLFSNEFVYFSFALEKHCRKRHYQLPVRFHLGPVCEQRELDPPRKLQGAEFPITDPDSCLACNIHALHGGNWP